MPGELVALMAVYSDRREHWSAAHCVQTRLGTASTIHGFSVATNEAAPEFYVQVIRHKMGSCA